MSVEASAPPVVGADVAVAARGLTKRFGTREVVSDLSFGVRRGHAFGLLGPNGAGKTTTVRLLTGLLTPDDGAVTLFGEPATRANADALRARIGVQTDTRLYESLTVRENLRTWGLLYGLPPARLAARVDEVLAVLGLADRAGSLAGELSKGMRQKLAIGRAILHEPELLFLDEPTAGLDPEAAADLLDHLGELIRAGRTTLVVCTHQLHGIEALCTDIGIITAGRLRAGGPVGELLAARWPQRRYALTVGGDLERAAAVVAAVVHGPVTRGAVTAAPGQLTFLASDEAVVPAVVAALVRADVPVRAVEPQVPTVEQLYFATLDDEQES
jgi:ABC-2 type transport system ATP-binding protein